MENKEKKTKTETPCPDHARAALFVDFENLYMAMRDESTRPIEATLEILAQMRKWLTDDCGLKMVVGRAYGTWDFSATREALQPLSYLGISPQYVLSRRARNSGDLKMSLDILDVLLTKPEIDTFVLVAGDKDYLYIAERIREQARDVLLVNPAATTSSELREIVGPDNFIDAVSLLPPELLEKPAPKAEAETAAAVEPEDLLRCAKLFLRARKELRTTDIWLGPFFKSYMNEAFSTKSNLQRKEIVSEMVRQEAIAIEDREDRYGSGTFSVVIPNWSHELFAKAEAEEPRESAPTAARIEGGEGGSR